MSKIEKAKAKTKPKNPKIKNRPNSTTKDSEYEFNFFDFLYKDENAEYKPLLKKEETSKDYINPKQLIEQLKKRARRYKNFIKEINQS